MQLPGLSMRCPSLSNLKSSSTGMPGYGEPPKVKISHISTPKDQLRRRRRRKKKSTELDLRNQGSDVGSFSATPPPSVLISVAILRLTLHLHSVIRPKICKQLQLRGRGDVNALFLPSGGLWCEPRSQCHSGPELKDGFCVRLAT